MISAARATSAPSGVALPTRARPASWAGPSSSTVDAYWKSMGISTDTGPRRHVIASTTACATVAPMASGDWRPVAGFRKRRHHGELVGNLVDEAPILAQEPAVDLARQVQDGRRRHASLELAPHGVRRSRTGRGQAHAEPAGRPREPVGRADGTLLVTDADRADPAVTPDRVVDREVVDTRDAEDDIDSRPREHVHDHVAACPICHLAPVLRFVSAGITGWRYTPQVASLRWMIASRTPDFSFVHAADLHLDTPFKGIGSTAPHVAEQLREASLAAFDSLVELCLERRVAFLVVAGDIYDGPERGLRAQLRFRDGLARLSSAGISSFVVHGNHDPVETGWSALGGPWPERVTVFGTGTVKAVPVEVDGSRRSRPCKASASPSAANARTWR